MAEYIERGEAIMTLIQGGCYASNIEDIMNIHAADVVPARHGKWIGKPISGFATVRCSVCRETFSENSGRWKFCPNCGAVMDLED